MRAVLILCWLPSCACAQKWGLAGLAYYWLTLYWMHPVIPPLVKCCCFKPNWSNVPSALMVATSLLPILLEWIATCFLFSLLGGTHSNTPDFSPPRVCVCVCVCCTHVLHGQDEEKRYVKSRWILIIDSIRSIHSLIWRIRWFDFVDVVCGTFEMTKWPSIFNNDPYW